MTDIFSEMQIHLESEYLHVLEQISICFPFPLASLFLVLFECLGCILKKKNKVVSYCRVNLMNL